jgi:hypothetical protein
MLVLHRPYWYDSEHEKAKVRVADVTSTEEYASKIRFGRGLPGLKNPKGHLLIGSVGYPLKRGRSEHVRVMPPGMELEWRKLQGEINALRREAAELVDAGFRRGDPYVHEEEA